MKINQWPKEGHNQPYDTGSITARPAKNARTGHSCSDTGKENDTER